VKLALTTKQIQMTKAQNPKQYDLEDPRLALAKNTILRRSE